MTEPGEKFRSALGLRHALRRWGRQPIPVISPELAREREKRGITTIKAALSSAHRQRQKRARLQALALVAASIVASLATARALLDFSPEGPPAATSAQKAEAGQPLSAPAESRSQLTLHREGISTALSASASLRAGDVLETGDVRGEFNLGHITEAKLGRATKVTIEVAHPAEQKFRLHQGQAFFQVNPARKARVVIETEDASVLVTGTQFSVTTGGGPVGPWTVVDVALGSVQVDSADKTQTLGPGDSWSSRAPVEHVAWQEPFPRKQSEAPQPPATNSKLPQEKASASTTAPHTHLAEENRLLQAALRARNQGQTNRCVALVDQLTSKYPKSPLRQEGLVLRFRCLRAAGATVQARRAAARYLAAYPDGFAQEEARAIVLDSSPAQLH